LRDQTPEAEMNLHSLVDFAQAPLDIPLWAGMAFLGVIYLMFRHQVKRSYEIHTALVSIDNRLAELGSTKQS
jgi:hypothetical protein